MKSSGNYPVFDEEKNLIPVEIKSNGDTYYANLYTEWYNYSEKRWANAVILTDAAKGKYTTGQKIEDKDIKGYFVWIPRYSYKLWDLGQYEGLLTPGDLKNGKETAGTDDKAFWKVAGSNSTLIDIKFVNTNTNESGNEVGSYLTHPAFTLGSKELSGIWVGKFETGGTNESTMVVKPNVSSWRNKMVKEFFDAGKNFARTLDSHMMKNTEWGAVAYLSHSAYGIGTEVNINNTTDFMTGYSATANADQRSYPGITAASSDKTKTQPWNTAVGYLASTTGNINGVYDMSGGVWEYMAACVEGTPNEQDSGFDTNTLASEMENGYIDKYPSEGTNTTYRNRILGDATGELGPFYNYLESNGSPFWHSSWYSNFATFVDSTHPWFGRGGAYYDGVVAGQFYFHRNTGAALYNLGFRLILAVK